MMTYGDEQLALAIIGLASKMSMMETYSLISLPQVTHIPPNWTLCAHGSSISATSTLEYESVQSSVVGVDDGLRTWVWR